MNCFKLVFIVVLSVLMGPCSLFHSKALYYYVVQSGCRYSGEMVFSMPNGQLNYDYHSSLNLFVSKAYRFETGQKIYVSASVKGQSATKCYSIPLTVTVMKSKEATEGAIGSGGSAWRTNTNVGLAVILGWAD